MIIQTPQMISISPTEIVSINLEITRLQNEINREIDKVDCNEGYAKALIMACATAKYNLCDDGSMQRIGQQIKAIFDNNKSIDKFDIELFKTTVDKVIVDHDGAISIKLKNNQVCMKGEYPCLQHKL